jgi:hypothetical protein
MKCSAKPLIQMGPDSERSALLSGPAVLKFAGTSFASVRHGPPEFILKLTAEVNSLQSFAKVRHGSPALLSELLSKCGLYKCAGSVAKRLSSRPQPGDHEQMHVSFDNRLVTLELVKRGWQLCDLATQAGLSEPTARAVVRGRGVSMVTALKVVRALERNPPNERLMALLNWHEAHPRSVVPGRLATASDH